MAVLPRGNLDVTALWAAARGTRDAAHAHLLLAPTDPDAVRIALVADGSACALRGAVAVVFGLVVLFMPGLGRVLLVPLLTVHLLWGGAIGLAALRRAPASRGLRDLRVLEAAVSMAAGVAVGEWPWAIALGDMLLPLLAAPGLLAGTLMLSVAARLHLHAVQPWLAGAGAVSASSSLALAATAVFLALDPEGLARFLFPKGAALGPKGAVLMVWFPLQTVSWGAALLAFAILRLAEAGPGKIPARAWLGWLLFAAAALAGVVAGLTALHLALVGSALLLAALARPGILKVRRPQQSARSPPHPG